MKVLYCAYGRAGLSFLPLILKEVKKKVNIFCLTYDNAENMEFVYTLQRQKINYSTLSIKDHLLKDKVYEFNADFVISIHYRDLISIDIINNAVFGGINMHPSILPKYRGAFSSPWAIINGEKETGITYHFMNENFDDGKIVLQKKLKINKDETSFSLFHKLIDLGVANFTEAFNLVIKNKIKGYSQKGEKSYYPRKLPYDGLINIKWDLEKIDRFIRAMTFPNKPFAKFYSNGDKIEIRNLEQYKRIIDDP